MAALNVGIIGAGNIFRQYIEASRRFEDVKVVAVADIRPEVAQAQAATYDIEALDVAALLGRDDIHIVINLTIPSVHADVDRRIIAAGKHVYAEKPLALTVAEGREVIEAARAAGVRVGSAPDTFLGGGLQTCRKILDDGWIGQPVAATAFMLSRGPESWHPNPAFFYEVGGGPLFDMGPYYITALVTLLGPVARVTASTRISFPQRIATSEARFGERLPVSVATHNAGILEFESGLIATLIMSFDVHAHNLPRIEIYGAEGTLRVPDPNTFGGPVGVWLPLEREWRDVPLMYAPHVGRGIGVADMARGIQDDDAHRASGDLAFHVLEVMAAFESASQSGRHVPIESRVARPEPLPMGLLPGRLRR